MIMQDFANFLAQNPWVLAVCALVTLWPVVRGAFRLYVKGFAWLSDRVGRPNADIQRSKKYPSYFLAIVLTYCIYFAGCLLARELTYLLIELIKGQHSTGHEIARLVLRALSIALSLLGGMLVGAVLGLCTLIRRSVIVQESEQS